MLGIALFFQLRYIYFGGVVRGLDKFPNVAVGGKIAYDGKRLLHVTCAAGCGHGAVGQYDFALAVEEQAAVAGYAPRHYERHAVGHRVAVADVDVAGHAPGVGFCDVYGPAHGLVQHGADHAAVDAAGIALMPRVGVDESDYATVLELVKTRVQAEFVVYAADEAVTGVFVLAYYLLFQVYTFSMLFRADAKGPRGL